MKRLSSETKKELIHSFLVTAAKRIMDEKKSLQSEIHCNKCNICKNNHTCLYKIEG